MRWSAALLCAGCASADGSTTSESDAASDVLDTAEITAPSCGEAADASACPSGCAIVTCEPVDTMRGCLLPTTVLGCAAKGPVTLDVKCLVAGSGETFRCRGNVPSAAGFRRCTDGERLAIEAPSCP